MEVRTNTDIMKLRNMEEHVSSHSLGVSIRSEAKLSNSASCVVVVVVVVVM